MGKYLFCDFQSGKRTTHKKNDTHQHEKPICYPKVISLKAVSVPRIGRTTRFFLRPNIFNLRRGIVSVKNSEMIEGKYQQTSSASVKK